MSSFIVNDNKENMDNSYIVSQKNGTDDDMNEFLYGTDDDMNEFEIDDFEMDDFEMDELLEQRLQERLMMTENLNEMNADGNHNVTSEMKDNIDEKERMMLSNELLPYSQRLYTQRL